MPNSQLHCNFCGKPRGAVDKLIAGPNVYICNECIEVSYEIIHDSAKDASAIDNTNIPTPAEIKEHFDNYIIGHHEAKIMLSVSAYNHYKRIFLGHDLHIEKSNILLVGPTGTGKTLFAKTLAEKMCVPFAIADATSLTESGYVGEDVESVIERLLSASGYDVEKAQQGIIYIDEIDKKAKRSESGSQSRDVSGEGVQQALLRLIEGNKLKVKVSGSRRSGSDEYVEFDTSDVLFIVGGAFVGIERHIEQRKRGKTRMGFDSHVIGDTERKALLSDITTEDVISYGLIPEFVGRLPIMGVLDPLDEDQLRLILTEVKNSLLYQTTKLIGLDGVHIEFGNEYLSTTANMAMQKKLGARALKSIVEQSMIDIMFRAPDLNKQGVQRICFYDYPLDGYKPTLVLEDGSEVIDEDYKLYRGNNISYKK